MDVAFHYLGKRMKKAHLDSQQMKVLEEIMLGYLSQIGGGITQQKIKIAI